MIHYISMRRINTQRGYIPWPLLFILAIIAVLVFIGQSHADAKALTYINLEYIFYKIYEVFLWIWHVIIAGTIQHILIILLGVLTVLIAIVAAYAYIRLKEIHDERDQELKKIIPVAPSKSSKNSRWEHIQKLLLSEGENDWRQAIIEADIILDEAVTQMGYSGADLGERLKQIEASDFTTLDDAWEAHKIRNRIAHDGSAFALSKHEAKRVIGLYENVFKEFEII